MTAQRRTLKTLKTRCRTLNTTDLKNDPFGILCDDGKPVTLRVAARLMKDKPKLDKEVFKGTSREAHIFLDGLQCLINTAARAYEEQE